MRAKLIVVMVLGLLCGRQADLLASEHCPGDINGDGVVGPNDLALLLGSWGPCDETCSDGILNGDETDIDCGGTTCPPCADGEACVDCCDCASGSCTNGLCAESCVPEAEICDGLDNDCDNVIDNGNPGGGAACDGADSDLCQEGVLNCVAGALVCSDSSGSTLDLCNGANDDCDAASTDGSEDPLLGSVCDGNDSDLCAEGSFSCIAAALICSDGTGSTLDLCNGADDDCDAASADGSEDPQNGTACDGPDSDLCNEGTRSCTGGALACSDSSGSTPDLCNGANDDCDSASADGSEDPMLGLPCDGNDSDLCAEGSFSCTAGALICSDATGSTVDLCNGTDDDCDAATPDDFGDPNVGTACDGPDSDLCLEGIVFCSCGVLVCSDNTGSNLDVCNGANDDCDTASLDGSEDPLIGSGCDGPDSDLCADGTYNFCTIVGVLFCSDFGPFGNLDICNGIDDDCDAASADGSEELQATCDGPDSDLCQEGISSCSGGALVCSDNTGNNLDICNGLNDDCDPASADGSEDPQNGTNCDGPDPDSCHAGTRSCSGGVLVCIENSQGCAACCSASGGLGCGCIPCEICVCGLDTFCCDTQWDGVCASEAANQCAGPCPCDNGICGP